MMEHIQVRNLLCYNLTLSSYTLSYNASIWFKRDVLSKQYSPCMMKTIRRRLNTSALCKDSPDGISLIFDDDYPHVRTYVYMFQRISILKKAA